MIKNRAIQPDLKRLSRVIAALRFPLIVLVVFIHVPLAEDFFRPLNLTTSWGSREIYYYVSKVISFVLGQAAVPAFFLFSGYYFFYKDQGYLDFGLYTKILGQKITTLLVPYVIWSILPFGLDLAKAFGVSLLSGSEVSIPSLSWSTFLYDALWRNAYNFSLWYVRDLLVLTCLFPLFYILGRRLPYLLVLLFVIYVWNVDTVIVSSRGIFYFALGSACGMRHIDIIGYLKPYRSAVLGVTILGTLLLPFNAAWPYHTNLLYLYVPFAIASMFILMSDFLERFSGLSEVLQRLSSSAFFVYVAHLVLILGLVRGRFYDWGIGETVYGYFLIGLLVVFLSWLPYIILKRFWPSLLGILVGGRS